MKNLLTILMAAGLLLYPFAALPEDYGSQSSKKQQIPPVAQTLVREGDFAIKLAAKLDLGLPEEEASAEEMLAAAGVVPSNGWLSDYPVTPEILGQLQDAITRSGSEGKLSMTAEEATRVLYSLVNELNLPVPADQFPASGRNNPQAPAQASNPAVINNYYSQEGPPIITYYPPPYDYAYLYAWVPYPSFWSGFWFPGFFICNNFTATVFVSHPFRHDGFGRHRLVTNRIIDPVSRRVAFVDPVTRLGGGAVQPRTVLRSESGGRFNNLAEFRKESAAGRDRRSVVAADSPRGFASTADQRSALNIYSRGGEKNFDRQRSSAAQTGVVRSPDRNSRETYRAVPGRNSDGNRSTGRNYSRLSERPLRGEARSSFRAQPGFTPVPLVRGNNSAQILRRSEGALRSHGQDRALGQVFSGRSGHGR